MNNITAWQQLGTMYSGNRISSEQIKTTRDILTQVNGRTIDGIQMEGKDLFLKMSTPQGKSFITEINYWGASSFVDKMPFKNP